MLRKSLFINSLVFASFMENEIIFFKLPICPKCKSLEGIIDEIEDENPEINVRRLNLITNIGLAIKHGITTVPYLLINGNPLKGSISKKDIENFLLEA